MSANEICPHCGVRVSYPADGHCPGCGVHRDEAVTEQQRARAAEIAARRAMRPVHQEQDRRRPWRMRSLGALIVGIVTGGLGITLTAMSASGSGAVLSWGLIAAGLASTISGAIGLFYVPSSEGER